MWTIGDIANGDAVTLEIVAEVVDVSEPLLNVAEVATSDQFDPDSTPGNGVTDEDDYDESTFVFDPPLGRKTFNADGLPELEWTMVWVNPNNDPIPVEINDPVTVGTSFVPGSLVCESPGTVTINSCDYDPGTNEINVSATI